MEKITITRSKWARVQPEAEVRTEVNGEPLLLNGIGCMCCMGFLCEQWVGVERDSLAGYGEPSSLPVYLTYEQDARIDLIAKVEEDAIAINDYPKDNDVSTAAEQEHRIAELFATIGVEAEFVD